MTSPRDPLGDLFGDSPVMTRLRGEVRRLLASMFTGRRVPPLLLRGETGTGKGFLARIVHRASSRGAGPFVDVNCAAIPESLFEAELFGFERGAFTDARQAKVGLFQNAHRGTLLLDEVGLLPLPVQAKLLKVIEERAVRRLGSSRVEPVDVWIVAATNEDLRAAMREGRFRQDLYHRIAVMALSLPPLRERRADIAQLAGHFLERACTEYGLPRMTFTGDALEALNAYAWPGNVRELGNAVERAALLADGQVIQPEELGLPGVAPGRGPQGGGAGLSADVSSGDIMRDHLLRVLNETGWNISRTASQLGLARNTVRARIRRFRLRPTAASRRPTTETDPASRPGPGAGGWQPHRVAMLRVRLVSLPEVGTTAARALDLVRDKVRAFGGRVDGVGPTGLVATFGLGQVEEPVAVAAHTALAIRRAAARDQDESEPVPGMLLAIHTARILGSGPAASPELDVDGRREAWTTLESLLETCAPDEIVATPAASAFLRQRFELVPSHGPGVNRLVGVEAGAARHAHHGVHFVGRRHEMELLKNRFEWAASGRGQIVEIMGEAGMGKSRLVLELVRSLPPTLATCIEARCFQFASGVPYFPVAALLSAACGVSDLDSPRSLQEKLAAALAGAGLAGEDAASALLMLCGADGGRALDPTKRKDLIFETACRLLVALSARRPLLAVVEDLHWMDATSEAFLESFIQMVPSARILLVLTYRPGYRPQWFDQRVDRIGLQPLSHDESLAVVREVLGAGQVAETLVPLILARAEGNPFFLGELTLAVRDAGVVAGQGAVPETVQEVLLARLRRLRAPHRHLLTVAAVVGKDVPLSLLRAVATLPEAALRDGLDELVRLEFLLPLDVGGETAYTLKHALTHDVAYASVAAAERRALHARIVGAIEATAGGRLVEHTEQLAHHALMGALWEQAVTYLGRSAERAVGRSANVEAIAYAERGLELLATFPESPERTQRQLPLQMTLATSLMATKGVSAPEAQQAYARARELCHRLGDAPHLFPALWGLTATHVQQGKLRDARELADQTLALARSKQDSGALLEAHTMLGVCLYFQGDLLLARSHLEQGMTLYEPDQHRALTFQYGFEPGVLCASFLGTTLGLLGYPDQALQRSRQARAIASEAAHPQSLAFTLYAAGVVHHARREWSLLEECAETEVTVSTEQGFPLWLAWGTLFAGRVLAEQGHGAEGIARMRQGLTAFQAMQSRLLQPYCLALLAEGHGIVGQTEAGLAVLAEALTFVLENGEHHYEAELYRLRGELLLLSASRSPRADLDEDAERWFRQALDLAHRQDARALELRAATSLARLLRRLGRRDEARDMLAAIHGWFTEGSLTHDVIEASALLEELGRGTSRPGG